MWVRFLKEKDDTYGELECILLEIQHLYGTIRRRVPSHR
jgi:hypothetical protein